MDALLAQLDLAKLAPLLREQDIDLETAKTFSEEDWKRIGLTIGAARKLTLALKSAPSAVRTARSRASAPRG